MKQNGASYFVMGLRASVSSFIVLLWFGFVLAEPMAWGSSWDRDQTRATVMTMAIP